MTTPTVVKFDGGTRPDNPGPSAIGYIVETDDWTEEGSEHIGESTNNRIEYRALIQGLELASEKGCTEVEARGDSEATVRGLDLSAGTKDGREVLQRRDDWYKITILGTTEVHNSFSVRVVPANSVPIPVQSTIRYDRSGK